MQGPRHEMTLRTPSGGKSKLAARLNGNSVDIDISRTGDGEVWIRLTIDQADQFANLILSACDDALETKVGTI